MQDFSLRCLCRGASQAPVIASEKPFGLSPRAAALTSGMVGEVLAVIRHACPDLTWKYGDGVCRIDGNIASSS